MDKKRDNEYVVKVMYKLGCLMLIPLIIIFFLLRTEYARQALLYSGYSCYFRSVLGVPCPGCGGTRAAILFANLQIYDSMRMHIAVALGAVMYGFFMITQFCHFRYSTKGLKENQLYFMIGLFVFVLIVRWLLLVFGVFSLT